MTISMNDVYAYQLVAFFISKFDYQLIKVKEYQDDLWLANNKESKYPMICIRSKNIDNPAEISSYMQTVHHDIQEIVHVHGPLLLIHTCLETVHLPLSFVHQVVVMDGKFSDSSLVNDFKDLDSCLHTVSNPAEEIIRLTKIIEDENVRQQKNFLAKLKEYVRPNITMLCMGVVIFTSILSMIMTLLTEHTAAGAIASFAYYKMNVVAAHEYFRLFTAAFVDVDIFGLIFLMFTFYQIGKLCEYLYKPWQYVTILIASSVCGYAAILIAEPNTIAFGMGAAIWGISAAYFVEVFGNKTYRLPIVKQSIFRVVLLDFMAFTFPGMSFLGHLTGFVTGAIFAILFSKCQIYDMVKKHASLSLGMLFAFLLVFALKVDEVMPIEKELDQHIIEVYRHTPLDAYADHLQACYNEQYRME